MPKSAVAVAPTQIARTIGMLSTYPPTQCGLATFTSALARHVSMHTKVGVVRVTEDPINRHADEVIAHLAARSSASSRAAAACLSTFDSVFIQHEYGIYGGADGRDVLDVVDAITSPALVVFHTVLSEPTLRQRRILLHLIESAATAVAMTDTAGRRLVELYGADPAHVRVIPHGAIDHGLSAPRKAALRPLILTWGLIGPGKGIEWALEAVAALRDLQPRYLVVGKTHPKVVERSGEAYREGLQERISELAIADLVQLDPSYVTTAELSMLIESADVVLLPYDSRDQVTSGVLIEAVAAGRPVVSTAFPHAVELLARGAGLVVPQADAEALSLALRRVLTEPGLSEQMGRRAADQAPALRWPSVASRYFQAAQDMTAPRELVLP